MSKFNREACCTSNERRRVIVMVSNARVGTVHCDVEHPRGLCAEELAGRQYYPLIKVYGSDPSRAASVIELQRAELPAAAVLLICTELLALLASSAPPSSEEAAAKTPPWGTYSTVPFAP